MKTKKQSEITSCEMCHKPTLRNAAYKTTLCPPCKQLFWDARKLADETRQSGWPFYNSTARNLFGSFILLCGLVFISPTPVIIDQPSNMNQIVIPPDFSNGGTFINLDDPNRTLMQVYCYPGGSEPFCIEYPR